MFAGSSASGTGEGLFGTLAATVFTPRVKSWTVVIRSTMRLSTSRSLRCIISDIHFRRSSACLSRCAIIAVISDIRLSVRSLTVAMVISILPWLTRPSNFFLLLPFATHPFPSLRHLLFGHGRYSLWSALFGPVSIAPYQVLILSLWLQFL